VLGFNLTMTAWIGEWFLFAAGVALQAALAILLLRTMRAPAPSQARMRRVQETAVEAPFD
jgi:hypothetical protein